MYETSLDSRAEREKTDSEVRMSAAFTSADLMGCFTFFDIRIGEWRCLVYLEVHCSAVSYLVVNIIQASGIR